MAKGSWACLVVVVLCAVSTAARPSSRSHHHHTKPTHHAPTTRSHVVNTQLLDLERIASDLEEQVHGVQGAHSGMGMVTKALSHVIRSMAPAHNHSRLPERVHRAKEHLVRALEEAWAGYENIYVVDRIGGREVPVIFEVLEIESKWSSEVETITTLKMQVPTTPFLLVTENYEPDDKPGGGRRLITTSMEFLLVRGEDPLKVVLTTDTLGSFKFHLNGLHIQSFRMCVYGRATPQYTTFYSIPHIDISFAKTRELGSETLEATFDRFALRLAWAPGDVKPLIMSSPNSLVGPTTLSMTTNRIAIHSHELIKGNCLVMGSWHSFQFSSVVIERGRAPVFDLLGLLGIDQALETYTAIRTTSIHRVVEPLSVRERAKTSMLAGIATRFLASTLSTVLALCDSIRIDNALSDSMITLLHHLTPHRFADEFPVRRYTLLGGAFQLGATHVVSAALDASTPVPISRMLSELACGPRDDGETCTALVETYWKRPNMEFDFPMVWFIPSITSVETEARIDRAVPRVISRYSFINKEDSVKSLNFIFHLPVTKATFELPASKLHVVMETSQLSDERFHGCERHPDDCVYRGMQLKTRSGHVCQKWSCWLDNTCINTGPELTAIQAAPVIYNTVYDVGDHSYCRNADHKESIWCFTTNPAVPKEACVPLEPILYKSHTGFELTWLEMGGFIDSKALLLGHITVPASIKIVSVEPSTASTTKIDITGELIALFTIDDSRQIMKLSSSLSEPAPVDISLQMESSGKFFRTKKSYVLPGFTMDSTVDITPPSKLLSNGYLPKTLKLQNLDPVAPASVIGFESRARDEWTPINVKYNLDFMVRDHAIVAIDQKQPTRIVDGEGKPLIGAGTLALTATVSADGNTLRVVVVTPPDMDVREFPFLSGEPAVQIVDATLVQSVGWKGDILIPKTITTAKGRIVMGVSPVLKFTAPESFLTMTSTMVLPSRVTLYGTELSIRRPEALLSKIIYTSAGDGLVRVEIDSAFEISYGERVVHSENIHPLITYNVKTQQMDAELMMPRTVKVVENDIHLESVSAERMTIGCVPETGCTLSFVSPRSVELNGNKFAFDDVFSIDATTTPDYAPRTFSLELPSSLNIQTTVSRYIRIRSSDRTQDYRLKVIGEGYRAILAAKTGFSAVVKTNSVSSGVRTVTAHIYQIVPTHTNWLEFAYEDSILRVIMWLPRSITRDNYGVHTWGDRWEADPTRPGSGTRDLTYVMSSSSSASSTARSVGTMLMTVNPTTKAVNLKFGVSSEAVPSHPDHIHPIPFLHFSLEFGSSQKLILEHFMASVTYSDTLRIEIHPRSRIFHQFDGLASLAGVNTITVGERPFAVRVSAIGSAAVHFEDTIINLGTATGLLVVPRVFSLRGGDIRECRSQYAHLDLQLSFPFNMFAAMFGYNERWIAEVLCDKLMQATTALFGE